jgi:hypothetical protein
MYCTGNEEKCISCISDTTDTLRQKLRHPATGQINKSTAHSLNQPNQPVLN